MPVYGKSSIGKSTIGMSTEANQLWPIQFILKRIPMAGTERQRELRRRRHRKSKLELLHKKSEKSSKAEKSVIAQKVRRLSPGAEQLIRAWKLL
ncbi:MAG: DUF6800 family protein [Pirellula sp.]